MQRAGCGLRLPPGSVKTNLIVNRDKPPFDNPELRRRCLAIDRQAFIEILTEGQGLPGGAMQPPPGGQWGMPREMLEAARLRRGRRGKPRGRHARS